MTAAINQVMPRIPTGKIYGKPTNWRPNREPSQRQEKEGKGFMVVRDDQPHEP